MQQFAMRSGFDDGPVVEHHDHVSQVSALRRRCAIQEDGATHHQALHRFVNQVLQIPESTADVASSRIMIFEVALETRVPGRDADAVRPRPFTPRSPITGIEPFG